MKNITQIVFTGWHLMRWLRLLFGIVFLVQAIQVHDWLVGLIAVFFLLTAITNTGCCGSRSCATPTDKREQEEAEEINYEEIK